MTFNWVWDFAIAWARERIRDRSPRQLRGRGPRRLCLARSSIHRIRSTIPQATLDGGGAMAIHLSCNWRGVIPAATTQFDSDLEVDLPATQRVQKALLQDGVHGLVLMGTVGEGNSLSAAEKRTVLKGAVEVAEGRVPVIAGVSELTTAAA